MTADLAITKDFLRRFPLLADISEDDLETLLSMSHQVSLPAGTSFIEEGAEGDAMYIILDGEAEITKRQGGQDVFLARRGPGDFVGEMALLKKAPRFASAKTTRETQLLVISQIAFQVLLTCSPTVPLEMMHTLLQRLQSNNSVLAQQQKLAGLGTLAAGLAHELNNPAAAIARNASQMREHLSAWNQASIELSRLALTEQTAAELDRLASQVRPELDILSDPLARSDREDDVQGWLEDHDIDHAWELAPALVAAGWTVSTLETVADDFEAEQVPVVLRWLAFRAATNDLLDEVQMSADMISKIVKAVKTYSYLGQAPIQKVDLHESLESTLTILKNKLKEGVTVVRDFDPSLPPVEAYGSELNQVWTNIIDNAIDAMDGRGTITLHTSQQNGNVSVQIQDSGPGIPPEIEDRIFEPFYTTKEPGKGTGLGLHIAHNIVVDKHRGEIEVSSRPGATCFQITLPVSQR